MPADNQVIGARLRAAREAPPYWSREAMARRLWTALDEQYPPLESLAHMIKGWERGKHAVSARYQHAYAKALDITVEELFAVEEDPVPPAAGSLQVGDARTEWDDDMYRRAALQLLTALSAGTAIPVGALETVLSSVERTLGDRSDFSLEDWEEIVWEYGCLANTGAQPGALIADLTISLVEVGRLLDRKQPPLVREGLLRVSAYLSSSLAGSFGELGARTASLRAWRTARRTADESGDRDLSVWVRGYEATAAFWTGRPGPVVIRLSDEAVQVARAVPSTGLAMAHSVRAYLWAARGDKTAARAALRDLTDAFARLPDSLTEDRFTYRGFPESQLRFNEGYAYSLIGDSQEAFRAVERALTLYPPERVHGIANLHLIQAHSLIRDRDVTQGLDHAMTATQGLPGTAARRRIAGQLIDALPDGKARALPAAQELRALTAGPLR